MNTCPKDVCWLEDRWWSHDGRWCAVHAACWLTNVDRPQEPDAGPKVAA